MSREVEYRRYAAALLDLATRVADAADKVRLLVIADAWLTLADKLARLSKQRRNESTRHARAGRAAGQDEPRAD
jgi:hypothetical protein